MELSIKRGLNREQLKLIAVIAMTVDHLAWVIWPGYSKDICIVVLHCIGRITAPIMWFFIAEGYYHTRSVKKYALRLLAVAIISHFAYTFAFLIVLGSIALAFINCYNILDFFKKRKLEQLKSLYNDLRGVLDCQLENKLFSKNENIKDDKENS